ncbi:uncharacterized protein LAESUDRAFT_728888 [Laetiporus sulphureus 93-53]|uniref:Uncharacterized protein n=1 Tax=Laetiporus sulphureus 93-53 TaxID=1314785 RepID=A0A165CWR2_9APHY|nr:uncharacterized protein LAESUDRAFT_728888 [Laetiporus sulphureus 93-53]KZT03609.1 hypothetical protein LAESUDRAFT_728888 [Laetiporus sulphureus 93-53]
MHNAGGIEKHVPYDLNLGVIELSQHRARGGTLQTRNYPLRTYGITTKKNTYMNVLQ